jgi:hypothetical protein
MTTRKGTRGSRYLYDSFDATEARIEANERVAEERWTAMEYRLGRIEEMLERLEMRLWVTAFGVLGAILAALGRAFIVGAG